MLVWVYVAAFPLAFVGGDYLLASLRRDQLAACDLGDMAVFGDSRAQADVIPALMPLPTQNLALPATNPVATWFAVEAALKCPNPPKLAVIMHGANVFTEPAWFWTIDSPLGFLSWSARIGLEHEALSVNDWGSLGPRPPDGLPYWAEDALFAVHAPSLFFASLKNARIGMRWTSNHVVAAGQARSRGHMLFGQAAGSAALAPESGLAAFHAAPLPDLFLRKTLALLEQRGVATLIVPPPLNRATYDRMGVAVPDAFAAYLRDMTRGMRHVRIAGDAMPCWPNASFGDEAHLNARGAEAYSREFAALIEGVLNGGPIQTMPDHCRKPEDKEGHRSASLP